MCAFFFIMKILWCYNRRSSFNFNFALLLLWIVSGPRGRVMKVPWIWHINMWKKINDNICPTLNRTRPPEPGHASSIDMTTVWIIYSYFEDPRAGNMKNDDFSLVSGPQGQVIKAVWIWNVKTTLMKILLSLERVLGLDIWNITFLLLWRVPGPRGPGSDKMFSS